MALSIKSDEADQLARELAAETGETLTEAVVIALRERLDREHARSAASMRTRLARLAADVAALPVADTRVPEEIIGYDDAACRVDAAARGSLVVDTSAAVAVILGEPGCDELAVHLENALARLMPAAIRVELGIVIEARLWPAGQEVVDRFLRDAKIDIVPVDADLAARAMSGWRRYGKGRHPAGLNFGDCLTYALAERTGHPVLCIGDDFAAADVAVVRPRRGPDPA